MSTTTTTVVDDRAAETHGEVTSTDVSLKAGRDTDGEVATIDAKSAVDDAADADAAPVAGGATDGDDESQYPTGMTLVLIITSLCLAVFLVALDQTIIAPALGAITAEFSSVKDIVSCPLVAAEVCAVPC